MSLSRLLVQRLTRQHTWPRKAATTTTTTTTTTRTTTATTIPYGDGRVIGWHRRQHQFARWGARRCECEHLPVPVGILVAADVLTTTMTTTTTTTTTTRDTHTIQADEAVKRRQPARDPFKRDQSTPGDLPSDLPSHQVVHHVTHQVTK